MEGWCKCGFKDCFLQSKTFHDICHEMELCLALSKVPQVGTKIMELILELSSFVKNIFYYLVVIHKQLNLVPENMTVYF